MYRILGSISLLSGILATNIAVASPTEVNLSINRQQSESYEQFVRRAETLANSTVQRRFQENRSLEELRVLVVGENQGAIAPLLTVQVNRDNWNGSPDVRRWQNVFPYSKDLLGFERPQAQLEKPTVPPSPTPTQVPTPRPETLTPPATPTPETPRKPDPAELIPLPYPDQIPSTQPQTPLPNQRLQPNRTRKQ